MFRILGKKVELYRYKIVYTEDEIEMQENCISTEHKTKIEYMLTDNKITFVTTPVVQTNNEWFDGLEFTSYDEALEIFNKGEITYKQNIVLKDSTRGLQLRADTDYIAIMTGVNL